MADEDDDWAAEANAEEQATNLAEEELAEEALNSHVQYFYFVCIIYCIIFCLFGSLYSIR